MEFNGFKKGIEFQSWWGPFVPLGVALAVGFLFSLGGGGFITFPFQMAIHELGHASTSWFTGHAAIPLPFITFWSGERSTFAMISMLFLVGLFLYQSAKEKKFVAAGFGVLLLMVLFWGCFVLDTINGGMYRTMGGLFGELFLSAVIFVFYHYEVPRRLRWDFWRLVMVFPASLAFFPALWTWLGARKDPSRLPRGSLFGDEFGDIDRLLGDYGWTEAGLVSFYLSAALMIGFVLLVHLGAQVFLAYRKGDPDAGSPSLGPPSVRPPSDRPPASQEPTREGWRSRRTLGSELPPPWDPD